ncbi:MAG: peptidoglycan-binding protein [Arenibacterium sp.]
MPVGKLKAPVGKTGRTDGGKPVKNTQADVDIARHALIANGSKIAVTGKSDTNFVKAIESFQKANKLKVDGIMDPGGPTYNKLLPKYSADVKKLDALKMQKIIYGGKECLIALKDYEAEKAKFFKDMTTWVGILGKRLDLNVKTTQSYYDQATFKDGYFKALCLAITVTWKPTKAPSKQLEAKAQSTFQALSKSVTAKDAAAFQKNLPLARQAIADYEDDVLRFLADISEGAKQSGTFLKTTSQTGFAILGCFATGPIAAGAGLTAGSAAMVSAASIAVLQKGSEEAGRSLYKWELDPFESGTNILFAAVIDAVTAGIGSKWKFVDAFVDTKLAPKLMPLLSRYMPGVTKSVGEDFIKNYLKGSGTDALKTAIKKGAELLKSAAEKGKTPSEKEFLDAVIATLEAGALGGVLKHLQTFDRGFEGESAKMIRDEFFPKYAAKYVKNMKTVDQEVLDKMREDYMERLNTYVYTMAKSTVFFVIDGIESPSQMTTKTRAALLKDTKVQSEADKAMQAVFKQYESEIESSLETM